jgi:hypothetical protein
VVSLDAGTDAPADFWLQRYGVRHKVWLRQGDIAALIPSSGGPFSACLMNGEHDRAHLAANITAALHHLTPGARIGIHGYCDAAFPDAHAIVNAAAARHRWQLIDRADFLAVFATLEQPGSISEGCFG